MKRRRPNTGCHRVVTGGGAAATAGAHAARRGGFSLIELMLAMTILGLGLVMVATMFPVAWTRARSLAEFTTHENVTQSAEFVVQQITRVDDSDPSTDMTSSFAGDVIFHPSGQPQFVVEANPRVHAMFLENVTVDAPRRFVPDRVDSKADEDIAPWLLEAMDRPDQFKLPGGIGFLPSIFYESAFGTAQISFNQRIYPPLPLRDFNSVDGAGLFVGDDDTDWENALDDRRYAWAVLHRLRREPLEHGVWDNLTANDYQAWAAEPREFDVYYVTLRRTRPTLRFAVQDSEPSIIPDPFAKEVGETRRRGLPVTPAAFPPDHDVVLPVPWRVQVLFPGTLASANAATGVPTEIAINTEDADTNAPFLVDFFDVGTPFIDEANGGVYRVTRRRIGGADGDEAYVTLDREVVFEDINDGFWTDDAPANQYDNGILDPDELLRTVWVFPPSVEKERDADGAPVFSGRQPVIDIVVRTLRVNP